MPVQDWFPVSLQQPPLEKRDFEVRNDKAKAIAQESSPGLPSRRAIPSMATAFRASYKPPRILRRDGIFPGFVAQSLPRHIASESCKMTKCLAAESQRVGHAVTGHPCTLRLPTRIRVLLIHFWGDKRNYVSAKKKPPAVGRLLRETRERAN